MAEAFPTFRGLGLDAATELRLAAELERLSRIAGIAPRSLEAIDLALHILSRHFDRAARRAPRLPNLPRPPIVAPLAASRFAH